MVKSHLTQNLQDKKFLEYQICTVDDQNPNVQIQTDVSSDFGAKLGPF